MNITNQNSTADQNNRPGEIDAENTAVDQAPMGSPFFTADIPAPQSGYWAARRTLAEAMRALQEQVLTADISEADALNLAERISAEADTLAKLTQIAGVVANAKRKQDGNIAVANHELLAIGGHSHPGAPGLRMWHAGDETHGSVTCGWAFEGPPGHVHGGWVAGILDHFMGIAHMRSGHPGMTGSLDIRYHRPTPLNVELGLRATHEAVSERRTKVVAEVLHAGKVTASAVAMFIRPAGNIFKDLGAD